MYTTSRGAPVSVHGVDFSGARDAGRRIFVASGVARGADVRIDAVRRGDELPGGGVERDAALAALRAFVAMAGPCVIGCDFPFAVPAELRPARGSWLALAAWVARHADALALRDACRARTGGREPRRAADVAARAPMAPTNLRVVRQTFHGIRDVLAPLAAAGLARVVPQQRPHVRLPALVEVCPASTLAAAGLRLPYKGRAPAARRHRATIVAQLASLGVAVESRTIRRLLVEDPGGDALDAVLAALGAARAAADLRAPVPRPSNEGRIWF